MALFARTIPPGGHENRWWEKIEFPIGESGIPRSPQTGTYILQSVDGVLQWVTVPKLLAVNEG